MSISETLRPSDGEPRPITLAQWRAEIINDIYRTGLRSGKRLAAERRTFIGSADSELNNEIHGINLHYSIDRRDSLEYVLHKDGNSILPVISERPSEDTLLYDRQLLNPQDLELLTRRVHSSFLVVCFQNRIEDVEHIPPNVFACVVFPRKIWEECSWLIASNQERKVPVKLVDKTVRRMLGHHHYIEVPDYENAVLKILRAFKEPIFVHGVRLPTEEDLERLRQAPQEEG